MPLRQDFSSSRNLVDASSPLRDALTNVQTMFAVMDKEDQANRRHQEDLLMKQAALAEDKRRWDESHKIQVAQEGRAVAAAKRAEDTYNRGIKEQESLDTFLKNAVKPTQERSGWLNPTNEAEEKFVNDISVFDKVNTDGTKISVDAQGNELTKEDADKRLSAQLEVGNLAGNTPSQNETYSEKLQRSMNDVIKSGGVPTEGMYKELLTAEAADKEARKAKLKLLEEENSTLAKAATTLDLDSSKTMYKESGKGKGGSGGGYKDEDWLTAQEEAVKVVSPLGSGPDAYDVAKVFEDAKAKNYPLDVVKNAVTKAITLGTFGNTFNEEAVGRYVDAELKEKGYGTGSSKKDPAGYKGKVDSVLNDYKTKIAANKKEMAMLGMSPDEQKVANADALMQGIMSKYNSAAKPKAEVAKVAEASKTKEPEVIAKPIENKVAVLKEKASPNETKIVLEKAAKDMAKVNKELEEKAKAGKLTAWENTQRKLGIHPDQDSAERKAEISLDRVEARKEREVANKERAIEKEIKRLSNDSKIQAEYREALYQAKRKGGYIGTSMAPEGYTSIEDYIKTFKIKR